MGLLPPIINNIKRAESLGEWLETQDATMHENLLLPKGENLTFDNFLEFVEKREDIIINKLVNILGAAGNVIS